MCSSTTKLEADIEFRFREGERRIRLLRILSVARRVTVGLPNERLSAAAHPYW
jgi:hypothetical protein